MGGGQEKKDVDSRQGEGLQFGSYTAAAQEEHYIHNGGDEAKHDEEGTIKPI